MTRSIPILAVVTLLGAASAHAAVPVEYDVDQKAFKRGATVTSALTFSVYEDAACATLLEQIEIFAGDPGITYEQPKQQRVKGGAKPPKSLTLKTDLETAAPASFWLEVTGPGIAPVGSGCQAQVAGGASGPEGPQGPEGPEGPQGLQGETGLSQCTAVTNLCFLGANLGDVCSVAAPCGAGEDLVSGGCESFDVTGSVTTSTLIGAGGVPDGAWHCTFRRAAAGVFGSNSRAAALCCPQ